MEDDKIINYKKQYLNKNYEKIVGPKIDLEKSLKEVIDPFEWLVCDSFCKDINTIKHYYVSDDSNIIRGEIEVEDCEGYTIFIDINTIIPYPQLNDIIKVIFFDRQGETYKIIPPDWNMFRFKGNKEKFAVYTYNESKTERIIKCNDGTIIYPDCIN